MLHNIDSIITIDNIKESKANARPDRLVIIEETQPAEVAGRGAAQQVLGQARSLRLPDNVMVSLIFNFSHVF